MYSPSTIKELFKTNETPYFTLKAKDNPYKPERFLFTNKNGGDMDVEKALKLFDNQLELHGENRDQIFVIELTRTKSGSHSSGIIGPLEFQLQGASAISLNPQNQFQGMAGMDNQISVAMGSLGAIYQQRDQFLLEKGEFNMKKALFDQEKKQWEAKKKETEDELKALKEKYESNSERVKHGLDKAFGKLLDGYLEMDSEVPKQLGSVLESDDPKSTEELKIQEIGETLFNALDEGKIDLYKINTIAREVNHIIFNQIEEHDGIPPTDQEI